ncbi:MAG: nucleoside deaminase [Candidatus Gastranaerophilales bacterium]|nr:nucleoside deaminase [Candidatus Gastranaerophilales bacterium]
MINTMKIHDKYMQIAIEEAHKSSIDVPIGAIIVKNDKIIAKAFNQKEKENDATNHAEILVIREASKILGNWRLDNTVLYVTLEPCPMCAGAILYSRIPNIYFGAYDSLYGAFGSALDLRTYIKFKPDITGGIQEEKCSNLLKNYFKLQRKMRENCIFPASSEIQCQGSSAGSSPPQLPFTFPRSGLKNLIFPENQNFSAPSRQIEKS